MSKTSLPPAGMIAIAARFRHRFRRRVRSRSPLAPSHSGAQHAIGKKSRNLRCRRNRARVGVVTCRSAGVYDPSAACRARHAANGRPGGERSLERQTVLVLDELAYVPLSKAEAELLFGVVRRADERTSPSRSVSGRRGSGWPIRAPCDRIPPGRMKPDEGRDMPARDVLDRFHLWFVLVRSSWLVRVREVLPRYDPRTPAQAEVLRHWAGVIASRRAAEFPGEALGPEFFEVACLAAARSANADDPFEWLDRWGRDVKSPRTAEVAIGLNNDQAPQLVASYLGAAPPLRRSFERVAAAVGLDPPSPSSIRDVLAFLAELVARFRPPDEAEYLAVYESLMPAEARELAIEAIEIAEAGAAGPGPPARRHAAAARVPGAGVARRPARSPPPPGLAPPGLPDGATGATSRELAEASRRPLPGRGLGLGHRRPAPAALLRDRSPAHPAPEEAAAGPVVALAEHEGQCGSCGLQLTTLFEFDLADERLRFLGVPGHRLRIAVCEGCVEVGEGPTYSSVDGRGGSSWRHGPGPPIPDAGGAAEDFDDSDRLPRGRLALGPFRRSPYAAFEGVRINHTGNSQLGGLPTWVQDPDYPPCPGCRRPMVFVGQVDGSDLCHGDSVLYAFLCAGCQIAAAGGQCS